MEAKFVLFVCLIASALQDGFCAPNLDSVGSRGGELSKSIDILDESPNDKLHEKHDQDNKDVIPALEESIKTVKETEGSKKEVVFSINETSVFGKLNEKESQKVIQSPEELSLLATDKEIVNKLVSPSLEETSKFINETIKTKDEDAALKSKKSDASVLSRFSEDTTSTTAGDNVPSLFVEAPPALQKDRAIISDVIKPNEVAIKVSEEKESITISFKKEENSSINKNNVATENVTSTAMIPSDQIDSLTILDKDTEVSWITDKITLTANHSLGEIERLADQYMKFVNEKSANASNKKMLTSWAYAANITEANQNKSVQATTEFGAFAKKRWTDLQTWKEIWPKLSNENLKRQFKLHNVLGTPALPEEKYAEYALLTSELEEIYSTATICDYHNHSRCDLSLEPDLSEILAKSRDYDELAYVWKEWRDSAGKPMKTLYSKYVDLGKEAAKLNGFPSMAEMWIHPYESETFENNVAELFKQMTPLYNQLQAYTRRKLREVYGEYRVSKRGPIPAHLLGNMWSQTWDRIYDLLVPYPNKTSLDVTDAMIAQNYTPKIIYQKADAFFASLGLERVDSSFWSNSVLEKPTDREIVCHASAWDFYDGKDFRIKQCTRVNMEDFATAHHELGHIQYYLQYKDLPHVFREGANDGFHEAIGDIMSLSVSTPKHLHKVGLLEELPNDYEADINFLMISALRKVAFLPFGYLIDKWRWDVFRGLVTPDNYTCAWWNYRYELQGIAPPTDIARTSADFDAGAKYHVAADGSYIAYFVSYVLQFQFHKSLCLLAGEYDPTDPQKPLHQCDIYQSLEAGNALRDLLKLGSSQHWTVTLKTLTGTDKMNLSPLMEYFAPLEKWLQEDNMKQGEFIGWEGGHGVC